MKNFWRKVKKYRQKKREIDEKTNRIEKKNKAMAIA